MSIRFKGKTSDKFPLPEKMKAWVLGDPDELMLIDKSIVMPGKAEVLVKIDVQQLSAQQILTLLVMARQL